MSLEEQLEEAQTELEEQSSAVREAFREWSKAQVVSVQEFLEEEGRLTATNQAAHTGTIADKIPALRVEISRAARAASESIQAWIDGIPDKDILTLGQKLTDSFQKAATVASQDFARVMTGAGYDGGGLRTSWNWLGDDAAPEWNFYRPSTGTARSKYFPMPAEATEYFAAVRSRSAAASHEARIAKQLMESRAADLWDSAAPENA